MASLPRVMFGCAIAAAVALALPALARTPDLEPSDSSTATDPATAPPSDPTALALLRRSGEAAVDESFQGSEVIAVLGSAPSTVIADVQHRALVGSELRVVGGNQPLGMLAFRPDDTDLGGGSPASSPLPVIAGGSAMAALIAQNFVVTDAGSEPVAGQLCERLELRRPSGSTAARVWVSTTTGLQLQTQVFDTKGELQRYDTFTDVAVVPDQQVGDVGDDMRAASADAGGHTAGQSVPSSELPALRQVGWVVPAQLADDLALVDTRSYGEAPLRRGSTGTLQLTFSDGLSVLTLSEQHGHLARKLPAGWVTQVRSGGRVQVQSSTPERLAWTANGTVFTVVSDTDDGTIDAALDALPRPAAASGFGPRMRLGLDRVGSWLDPTS